MAALLTRATLEYSVIYDKQHTKNANYLHAFHDLYRWSGELFVYDDHVATKPIRRDDVTSVNKLTDVVRISLFRSGGNTDRLYLTYNVSCAG